MTAAAAAINAVDHETSNITDERRRSTFSSPGTSPADFAGAPGKEVDARAAEREWTTVKVFLVLTCTSAMLLNIASSSAAGIALPQIGRDFNVEEDKLQWVVSTYSLSSGCLLIFFGRLADLYGRKKAFLLGTAFLGIFSLGCGFAQNIITLDVLRALQGLGPAAFVPASLGILAHAFPPSRARSIAFASFSAGAPVGAAVGMQIGGILTQWAPATWRGAFYLCAGLSVPIFVGGMFTIDADPPLRPDDDRRVDWLGAALVTVSLVLIQFVLGQGELERRGWKTGYIIALLIIGVLLLILFIIWQYYLEHNAFVTEPGSEVELQNSSQVSNTDTIAVAIADANADPEKPDRDQIKGEILEQRRAVSNRLAKLRTLPPPLMKLSLWSRAHGKFAVMQLIAFLEWSAFQSWYFWAQLYYQDFEGFSPILTAVRFAPMTVVGVLCNVVVALVIGRVDVAILVVFGTFLTSLAGLLFAVINIGAPYWAFGFPAAIVSVFGADFVFSSGTLFVARVSEQNEQSLAGGLFQTVTQIGTAFGLSITTIVHNSVLKRRSAALGLSLTGLGDDNLAPRQAQMDAYRAAQWTCFAFAIAGSVLAAIFLRGVGAVGDTKPQPSSISADAEKQVTNGESDEEGAAQRTVSVDVGGDERTGMVDARRRESDPREQMGGEAVCEVQVEETRTVTNRS